MTPEYENNFILTRYQKLDFKKNKKNFSRIFFTFF